MRLLLCSILLATSAFAGSAGFMIQGKGIELGEAKELYLKDAAGVTHAQPPRFPAKIKKGRAFTLLAKGTATSRGQEAQPFAPDSGEWTYDRKFFQALPADKKAPPDKTVIAIRLKAVKPGNSRIRFTGKVLGYENEFDVDVEIAGP
jgi:hypothetical protein